MRMVTVGREKQQSGENGRVGGHLYEKEGRQKSEREGKDDSYVKRSEKTQERMEREGRKVYSERSGAFGFRQTEIRVGRSQ